MVGAAALMAGLVIATLLTMSALLGHALSPSLSASAPDSVASAQPAAAPNLQVITPAAIAANPTAPILVYQAPVQAQPILVAGDQGTAAATSKSVVGAPATSTHPAVVPAGAAVKAPAPASGMSVSTSGVPTNVATSASGQTVAGGVAPETLPAVPTLSTAPGVTTPAPAPSPPASQTAAAGPNTNQASTNTNIDWSLHHHH